MYCANCGASQQQGSGPTQSSAAGNQKSGDFLRDLSPRTAAVLCYIPVVGWIPALIVLASARFRGDRETRFHGFQGLYLFVAWLMVDWVVKPIVRSSGAAFTFLPVVGILKALLFGAWIWMLVKVSNSESFKLPFLGDLAERSASEQR
jgi:uncharacterized membrane protein